MRIATRSFASLICITFFAVSSLQAAGTRERRDINATYAEEDQKHNENLHEEQLPEITAVRLSPGEKIKIVASTSIVGDVVTRVAGDAADVTTLIKVGQDPHSFEPTPTTLAAVERAHVTFVSGFGLEEGFLDTISATAKGYLVSVSSGIDPITREDEEHDGDGHERGPSDPHVWFDPTNVMAWTKNVELVLSEADPENSDGYHERSNAYLARLAELDNSIRERIATIPKDRRKLVADHRAFAYFAEEYGLELVGTIVPDVSTSSGISPRRIAEIVELLKDERISTIFVGSTANRGLEKLVESIRRELGNQVSITRTLTGSLSETGTPGETYIGYMEYNVERIIEGLMR